MNDVLFIHIPKCGGTTICHALGIETTKNAQRYDFCPVTKGKRAFGHGRMRDMLDLGIVTPGFKERAFKFSFIRNPYDRVVSHWAFSCATRKFGMSKDLPFKEYAESYMKNISHHCPMSDFFDDELDYLGDFENLEDNIMEVAELIGMNGVDIPHLNATKHLHYRDVLSKETGEMVSEFYAQDFKRFGYKLEEFE